MEAVGHADVRCLALDTHIVGKGNYGEQCIQEDEVLNIEKAPQNYHLTVTLYVPMWVCSE